MRDKCKKHGVDLECLGGASAHPDNWYCAVCDFEKAKAAEPRLIKPKRKKLEMLPAELIMWGRSYKEMVRTVWSRPDCPERELHLQLAIGVWGMSLVARVIT